MDGKSLTVLKTSGMPASSRSSPVQCSQEMGVRSRIVTTSSSTNLPGLGPTSTSLFLNFFFLLFRIAFTEVAMLGDDVPFTCTPRSYRHSFFPLFFTSPRSARIEKPRDLLQHVVKVYFEDTTRHPWLSDTIGSLQTCRPRKHSILD